MLKKVLALALAGAMVLGSMSLSAFAAPEAGDAPYDSKLVISGLADGDTVKFYQVLEWEEAGAANAVIPNSAGGWIYTTDFIPMSTTGGVAVDDITSNGVSAETAGKLARMAEGKTPTITSGEASGGKVEVAVPEDTGAGLYVAIITPKDVNTVYNPVIVSADYNTDNASASWQVATTPSYSDSAAAKKSTLEILKSASTEEEAPDDVKPETTAIGDTVSFEVKTTIPGYGPVYTNPQFIMTDKLTDLEMTDAQQAAITVTGVPATFTTSTGSTADTYTITPAADNYKIVFNSEYLKTLTQATPIVVTYSAIVTTDALQNVNAETNEVDIAYSHNPSDNTGADLIAKKDTTQHYTFTIDANNLGDSTNRVGKSGSELIKVGVDANGNPITESKTWSNVTEGASQQAPLAGASFKLYRDADCTEEYIPKDPDTGEETGTPLTITSDANGRILIPGLDAGEYWLKETAAPAGYIKAQEAVHIEIEAEFEEKTITEYYKVSADGTVDWKEAAQEGYKAFDYKTKLLKSYTVKVNNVPAATHTFVNESKNNDIVWASTDDRTSEAPQSIVNRQGVELPSTGGVGTTIFYMGGALLVLLAGVLLVSKRRVA